MSANTQKLTRSSISSGCSAGWWKGHFPPCPPHLQEGQSPDIHPESLQVGAVVFWGGRMGGCVLEWLEPRGIHIFCSGMCSRSLLGPGGCTCVKVVAHGRGGMCQLPVTPQQLTQPCRLEKPPKSLSKTTELEAQSTQSSPRTGKFSFCSRGTPGRDNHPHLQSFQPGAQPGDTVPHAEGDFYTHPFTTFDFHAPPVAEGGGFPQPKGEGSVMSLSPDKGPLSRSGDRRVAGRGTLMWQRAGSG